MVGADGGVARGSIAPMVSMPKGDLVRSVALAGAAVAQIAVPVLVPVLGGSGVGENVGDYDTAVTPPGYAFSVWTPIFAGGLLTAWQHAADPGDPANRAAGWPLAGAFAADAAWTLATQTGHFPVTPAILPIGTALAADSARPTVARLATGLGALAVSAATAASLLRGRRG